MNHIFVILFFGVIIIKIIQPYPTKEARLSLLHRLNKIPENTNIQGDDPNVMNHLGANAAGQWTQIIRESWRNYPKIDDSWDITKKVFRVYIEKIPEVGPRVNAFFHNEVSRALHSFKLMLNIDFVGVNNPMDNDLRILFVTLAQKHIMRDGSQCAYPFDASQVLGHTFMPNYARYRGAWYKRTDIGKYNSGGEIHLNLETIFYSRNCVALSTYPIHGIYTKAQRKSRRIRTVKFCTRDLINAIYHEIGHAFGFNHHPDPKNIMYNQTLNILKTHSVIYTQDYVSEIQKIYKLPEEEKRGAHTIYSDTHALFKNNTYMFTKSQYSLEPNSSIMNIQGIGNVGQFRKKHPNTFEKIFQPILDAEVAFIFAKNKQQNL